MILHCRLLAVLSILGVAVLTPACGRVAAPSNQPTAISWHTQRVSTSTAYTAANACRGAGRAVNVNDKGNGQAFPRMWWAVVPWSDALSKALHGPYTIHAIWMLNKRLLVSGVRKTSPKEGIIGLLPKSRRNYGDFGRWQVWDTPGIGEIHILSVRSGWVNFETQSTIRGVFNLSRGTWYLCAVGGKVVPLVSHPK